MERSCSKRSVTGDTTERRMRFSRQARTRVPFLPLFEGPLQFQIVFIGVDVRIIVVFARVHKANLIPVPDEKIPGPLIPCQPVKGGKEASADDDRMGSSSSHLQRPQGPPGLQISGQKTIDDS